MRHLYRLLIQLHPPEFRQRFGEEIMCDFDEAGGLHPWTMIGDGITSLFRNWATELRCGGYCWACLVLR